ncbi:MAG: glycosyltransferase [Acidimicrobiia bacterium]|nr:glycosyltransferase [Acidimicrobiia bacterium]
MRSRLTSIKRRIHRSTPDGVVNVYRTARAHARRLAGRPGPVTRSRTNIDIVAGASDAKRWLRRTPPTVRVVDRQDAPPAIRDDVARFGNTDSIDSEAGWIGWEETAAVVSADVHLPKQVETDETPRLTPTGLIVSSDTADALSLGSGNDISTADALNRIVNAGYRIRVVPNEPYRAAQQTGSPIGIHPVVVFAAVPMHDVGGGSRGTQIALELVRRGHHVTYVNRYESHEAVDLGLRFIHPRLEQVSLDRFDAGMHADRTTDPGLVIVELPDPTLSKPIATLVARRWLMVFDLIDDWSDPSLGGSWYSAGFEKDLIVSATAVSASAPDLLKRFKAVGRNDGVLVPNAVNETVFEAEDVVRPDDLPAGPIIGYHGSLYGNWIDWEAIIRIANRFTGHSVVLIGEGRGVPKGLPSNVHLLGMRPQGDLPAYVTHFDVAIVPFVVSDTTHAVSPLKVYEYLACGVPVAAPPLRSLVDLVGVHTDVDLVTAVQHASAAERPNRQDTLREHSWTRRMVELLPHVGWSLDTDIDDRADIAYRPVVVYRPKDRHIAGLDLEREKRPESVKEDPPVA